MILPNEQACRLGLGALRRDCANERVISTALSFAPERRKPSIGNSAGQRFNVLDRTRNQFLTNLTGQQQRGCLTNALAECFTIHADRCTPERDLGDIPEIELNNPLFGFGALRPLLDPALCDLNSLPTGHILVIKLKMTHANKDNRENREHATIENLDFHGEALFRQIELVIAYKPACDRQR